MAGKTFKVESGLQLLSRLQSKTRALDNPYPILFETGSDFIEVIEVVGEPGSGKSIVLSDIACEAILSEDYGGAAVGVLIINTDGNINIFTIRNMLRSKLLQRRCNKSSVDLVLQESLRRLFFINTYNNTEFLVTLKNLVNILNNYGNLSLLIIDTLTAYYWTEQSNKQLKMSTYTKNILNTIESATKDNKLTTIYSKQQYIEANRDFAEKQRESKLPAQIKLSVHNVSQLCHQALVNYNLTTTNRHFVIEDDVIKWELNKNTCCCNTGLL